MVVDSRLKSLAAKDLRRFFMPCAEVFSEEHFASEQFEHVEITLNICGAQKIRTLNRQYRGKDSVTDVLSFPLYDNLKMKSDRKRVPRVIALGDIIICEPVAKKQAKALQHSFWGEMIHLLTHGYLHLLGWDHEKSRIEEKKMQKLESGLVQKIYHGLGWEK